MKIKLENLFVLFYKLGNKEEEIIPNDLGRKQFFENQSYGKYKIDWTNINPEYDNYYLILTKGKESFDLLTRELEQLYGTREWWGLYQLWEDWKGNRWVLPYILKWKKDLPDWITKED